MGTDFSFVHCADLHLGSRFYAVTEENPGLGKRLYDSVFRSFSRIVELAKERADFMVISGDVYDDTNQPPRTRLFFCEKMREFGKPCFIVRGNHDFKTSWDGSIAYPDNVRMLEGPDDRIVMNIGGREVEIIGSSYTTMHTSENLAAGMHGTPGMFTIGMVHCSVDGYSDNADYAPCRLSDMIGKDIQYWALGHIHKRAVLKESDPCIVYPGNIQGRSPNETGKKGCYLVSVTGDSMEKEFVPTQEVLWKSVKADITWKKDVSQLVDSVIPECPEGSVVCLTFVGRGPLNHVVRSDPEGIAAAIAERAKCSTDVRGIETRPDADLEAAAQGKTLVSGVLRTAKRYSELSDSELLDLLCPEGPASDMRPYLQYYAERGELRRMVDDAALALVDRIWEGGR